jgi:hypothetical protein
MASGRGLDPFDKTLWMEFIKNFNRAFTDTTMAQNAFIKLKTLKMTRDNLNMYIATHESLILQAGWDPNGDEAAESFHYGLKDGLHTSIIKNHTPVPKNIGTMERGSHSKTLQIRPYEGVRTC